MQFDQPKNFIEIWLRRQILHTHSAYIVQGHLYRKVIAYTRTMVHCQKHVRQKQELSDPK